MRALLAGLLAYYDPSQEAFDQDKSKGVQIGQDGRQAPFNVSGLVAGQYVLVGFKDMDGDGQVSPPDYLGIYTDSQGNVSSPPAGAGCPWSWRCMVATVTRTLRWAFLLGLLALYGCQQEGSAPPPNGGGGNPPGFTLALEPPRSPSRRGGAPPCASRSPLKGGSRGRCS